MLAAIDNSAAARPVLAVAGELGDLLRSEVAAVHVREDGARTARAEARAAGVELRELADPTEESLLREARRPGVAVLVVGARGIPAASGRIGHVALELITALDRPVLVVPSEVELPFRLRRVLVPLDGTLTTTLALREMIDLVCETDVELIALHVLDERSLPRFVDQPQHEVEAWAGEFLARYCPGRPDAARLEVRVGPPGRHVLEVARDVRADLLVLGWSQDLSPGRAKVVREAIERGTVPTLLVPVAVTAGEPA